MIRFDHERVTLGTGELRESTNPRCGSGSVPVETKHLSQRPWRKTMMLNTSRPGRIFMSFSIAGFGGALHFSQDIERYNREMKRESKGRGNTEYELKKLNGIKLD